MWRSLCAPPSLLAAPLLLFALLALLLHSAAPANPPTPPPSRSFQFQASPTLTAVSPSGAVYAYYNGTQQVLSYFANGSIASALYAPFAVSALAVDAAGNVYLGNGNSSTAVMQKLSPSGALLASWDGGDNFTVSAIAIDRAGQVWATNSWSNLHRFDAAGGAPTLFINSHSYTRFPSALTMDSRAADTLWWMSGYNNELSRVNTTAGYVMQYWTLYALAISGPTGIAVDSAGLVYLADPPRSQVVKLNVSTPNSASIVASFALSPSPVSPLAVALNADDTLWVADTASSLLSRYSTATGARLSSIGSPYPALSAPNGLAVDSAGAVHVLDSGKARVLTVTSSGLLASNFSIASTSYRGLAINTLDGSLLAGYGSFPAFTTFSVYSAAGAMSSTSYFASYSAASGLVWLGSPLSLPSVVVLAGQYLYRWWLNGTLASSPLLPVSSTAGPQAIAVSPAGQLLVLYPELRSVAIVQVTASLSLIGAVALSGGPSVQGSQSLACDSLGQLYIAAPASNQILRFSYNGTFLEAWNTAVPPSLAALALLIDLNGDVWAADGPNNRLVLFQQSAVPQLIQYFYISAAPTSYPSVCVSAVLSCSLVAGGAGQLLCTGVVSGSHTLYTAAATPSVVTALTSAGTCKTYGGQWLPLGPAGLYLGWGTACGGVFETSGRTSIAVEAVRGSVNASYSAVGGPSLGSCPAPVLPAVAPGPASLTLVYYVHTPANATVCGVGQLACTAYGSAVYQCSLQSGTEFFFSPLPSPTLRSAALSVQPACTGGDGVLPFTYLGLSFNGTTAASSSTPCTTVSLSPSGPPQLSTATGVSGFTYGVIAGSAQQICSQYIPQLAQSSSSSAPSHLGSSSSSTGSGSPSPAPLDCPTASTSALMLLNSEPVSGFVTGPVGADNAFVVWGPFTTPSSVPGFSAAQATFQLSLPPQGTSYTSNSISVGLYTVGAAPALVYQGVYHYNVTADISINGTTVNVPASKPANSSLTLQPGTAYWLAYYSHVNWINYYSPEQVSQEFWFIADLAGTDMPSALPGAVWTASQENEAIRFAVCPLAGSPSLPSSSAPAPDTGASTGGAPVVYSAALLSASQDSFVAGQSASVALSVRAVQNVLLVLLNTTGNVTDDSFDTSALPAVQLDPGQWGATLQAYRDLAEAQSLAVLYFVDSLDELSADQSVGELSVNVPPMTALGYHRLLVVTGNGTLSTADWVFVVPFECTTWLREDGSCADSCPDGGFCLGDGRVWPEPGWWSVDEHAAPGSCPLNVACPGALETAATPQSPSPVLLPDGSRDTQRCDLGYAGPYCAQCAPLYYHAGSACRFCGTPDSAQHAGVAIVAVIIAALVALLLALSSPLQLATQVGVILIVQQLVTLGQTAGAALPASASWLQKIFQWLGLINLDVAMFQPGCLIAQLSFLDVFGWTLAIAAFAALLFTAAAALRATLFRSFLRRGSLPGVGRVPPNAPDAVQPAGADTASAPSKALQRWQAGDKDSIRARMEWLLRFDKKLRADASVAYQLGLSGMPSWRRLFNARWQHAMVVWGALIYLRLTTASLQMLHCVKLAMPSPTGGPSISQTVLVADFSTVCWHGAHIGGAVAALIILLVLSAGFPVVLGLYLLRLHSPTYLQRRMDELHTYTAKVSRAGQQQSASRGAVASAPAEHSTATPQSESLRQFLYRVYSSSASSVEGGRATSDPAASPRPNGGSVEGDVELSRMSAASHTSHASHASHATAASTDAAADTATATDEGVDADDQVALQLVQAAVLDRLTSKQLSEKDAAHLDMAYLRPAGHMVLAERDALYAYVLTGYRTDDRRRVHLFPLVTFVLAFLFCCTVVFPSTIALTLLLSGLTFLAQGALVALLQPFVSLAGNVKSVLVAAAKLLQCLVALGLIAALNTSVIHGDASAVHASSQQQRLSAATFRLFAANASFIVALCVLLLLPALLAAIGWRVRAYFRRQEQRRLWADMERQTDYSVTARSRLSRQLGDDPYAHDPAADTEPLPHDASYDEGAAAIDSADPWADPRPLAPPLPPRKADNGSTRPHNTAEDSGLAAHGQVAAHYEGKEPDSELGQPRQPSQSQSPSPSYQHYAAPIAHLAVAAPISASQPAPPPRPQRRQVVTLPTAPPILQLRARPPPH